MNGHVALLGDSILDNGAYTSGGPDVITHVRGMLPDGWQAMLLALDGSLIGDLEGQLSGLPPDTTIEPSIQGGEKIARAIVRSLGLATPSADPSRVYF